MAAILKIEKLLYLHNRLADFDEILHGDAHNKILQWSKNIYYFILDINKAIVITDFTPG